VLLIVINAATQKLPVPHKESSLDFVTVFVNAVTVLRTECVTSYIQSQKMILFDDVFVNTGSICEESPFSAVDIASSRN